MGKKQLTAVVELNDNKYKTKIYADGHFIYADEPEELGGTNEGMPPGALLLASLGSCTAITIRMYADRKQMPLEGIVVNLAICAENEMDKGTIIERKITLKGDLDDEQRKRLMIIADKCPIHKILSNPITIVNN
ncbi:OsmC family protein [Pedobacter sp. UBA4863]|uniref:OsmC family protein n=1 Tax=Pedobacter sp. UBA4863 TaxID=1947060 RepID=UPI0025D6E47E|nr:OsmC family protein [Pedobacter sp. UBA4863]